MKTIKTLLFGALLSLIPWQGFAQSPQTIYDGADLPTSQGWNEQRLDDVINPIAAQTSATVADGALKLTSTNAVNQFSQLGWYRTDQTFDLATGFTIEIKAKVLVADKTGAFNIQGKDKTGKGFRIGILADKITELTNPLAATYVLASGLTNDDDFHVYKFAFAPSGIAAVYRDGTLVGSFPLSIFDFDNYFENGGFEDADYPDFMSNGILRRISKADDTHKVNAGDYSLEMDNNGLVTDGWTNIENARTREIAIKPNTQYEFRITRRRTASEPWCWRDGGAFYNGQKGTLNGVDERGINISWWAYDRFWQTHPQDFTTPAMSAENQSVRLEFPTWIREGINNLNTTGFDNVVLREKPAFAVLPSVTPVAFTLEPVIPEGITNLIINGGFEDFTVNNDGTPYEWALSNDDNLNEPLADNPMWGNNVRIQRNNKADDFDAADEPYARSGSAALRFSSMNDNSKNIDFRVELEANKTYRFVFWHRNPKWDDWCWYFVRIGEDDPIWGHRMGSRANKWIPVDLTFTTTEENRTLHLYSTSETHGGWYNQYFDDMTLYEVANEDDPLLAGKTNLIANGDFEDITKNNDGSNYDWALSNPNSPDDAFPMAYNEMWGTWLRIQDKEQRGSWEAGAGPYQIWGDRDDTGYDYAHSGKNSIRFSYLDNWDAARDFEGLTGDVQPQAYQLNMNFRKDLEPNKTYTFVFWIKTSVWNDQGWIHIANGQTKVMSQLLNNRYMNWSRQQVTFSTTADNHTLRMYSEFGGWMNFYLDDLFLYEEDTYVPAPAPVGDTYLAFGKSVGTSGTDVEIEYVKVDNTGSFIHTVEFNANGGSVIETQIVDGAAAATQPAAPTKEGYTFAGWYSDMTLTTPYDFADIVNSDIILYAKWSTGSDVSIETVAASASYLKTYSANGNLTVSVNKPSFVSVYAITGTLVANVKIESGKTFNLPAGVYLVKSVSESGEVCTAKALNK